MAAVTLQTRRLLQGDHLAIDAHAHEALSAQPVEDRRVFALSAFHHGRQQHHARSRRLAQDAIVLAHQTGRIGPIAIHRPIPRR